MRGNSHVRFGAGDEETCLGNEARRFIPTLPADPAELSLSIGRRQSRPRAVTNLSHAALRPIQEWRP